MKKILVVDDDKFILKFMNDLLSKEGHQVLTAEDGLSALDILKTYTPDVIFIDLVMPNINGKKLCKSIRGIERLKDAYIIIISAAISEEVVDIAEWGFNACIVKRPFSEMASDIFLVLEQPDFVSSQCLSGEVLGIKSIRSRRITKELLAVKKHSDIVLEKISEGILEVTSEGSIFYANPTALSFFHTSEELLLGSNFAELFAGDERQRVRDLLRIVSEKPKTITEESPLSLNEYQVQLKILPIGSDESTSVIIINDVTEQERAEVMSLHNRVLRLHNQASQAFNSSLKLDKVLITVLEEVRQLMGVVGSSIWLTEEETGELVCEQATGAYGDTLRGWRLAPGEGLAGWVANNGEGLIAEDSDIDERHHKKVDQQIGRDMRSILTLPLRVKGYVIGVLQLVDAEPGRFDATHLTLLEPLAGSAAIAIDNARLYENGQQEITIRKQTEEALRVSEEKYRIVLEANPDSVVVFDMEGKVTYLNPTFTKVFGWSLEELLGNKMDMFVPKENRSKTKIIMEKILAGENISGIETRRYTKEGTIIHVSISGAIYRGRDGNPGGSIVNIRDVSEQKKLEGQLQQAKKMEAIGLLAGGVAHDLNNVLTGAVTYPDLLLMQIPEDSPLRESILTIQESGKKAATIVQDLLTLARRGVVTQEVVNLNAVISEYLATPEHEKLKLYHPGVEVEADWGADLLNISGSPLHLSKTVMNLVSNAAEAMFDGGKIFISTENRYIDRPISGYAGMEEGDYVVLTVTDTGTGISTENLDRIFEPFYTKKVMGRSGTGLGMAVVWGTVKDHKGYIDVQSTKGKGTTFTLYFPATSRKIAKDKIQLPIADYAGKGESILVVDDIKEQRDIASNILTALEYVADTVSSGEEAVEYLKAHNVDLIVLDMIMDPGIDGLDTYKKILEVNPRQKAIIASGFSETVRVREAQRLGAGTYIKKPYTMEKMGLAIRNELAI